MNSSKTMPSFQGIVHVTVSLHTRLT